MSVVVRPAGAEDIDGIVDLLHGLMSSKISKVRWRGLLDYSWLPPGADRGQVALDDGRVVGFLGLVYVDRRIAGRVERFCNICAWYLLRDYRGRGIGRALQYGSIADKDLTYTLVTATDGTDRAFRASGFHVLDEERYVLSRKGEPPKTLECVEGADALAPLIGDEARVILNDHRAFNLRHLFVGTGGRSCYLVVQNRKQGADVNTNQVMYLSDPEFVAAHGQAIADAVLEPEKSVLTVDCRFMPETMPWAREKLRRPRLYASPRVAPAAIDHLYNEVVLLDLKLP